jgi:tetratricopeptide (TPR) repeat protein
VNTVVLFGLLVLLGAIFSLILYALGGGFAPSKEGLEATARAALAKARASAQAGDFDQALEMCRTALEAAGKAGIASLEGEAQTLMRDAEQLRSQLKQIETRVSDLLGRTVDENDSAALARWLEEAEAVLRDTQNPRFTEAQLAQIARLAEFRQVLTGRQLKVRGEEERIQQVHARRAEAQQKKEAGEIAQAVRILEEALRLAQDARNEYLRNQIQRDIEFWRGEEAQNLAQRVIDEAKGIKRREGNAAARRYVEAQMPRFEGTAGQQRLQRYIEENLSEGR